MSYYGFQYFCGANVVVSVEGMPLLECAGLQYEAQESKIPVYGYSSRHYDAVARGQVIVQGTLLVNYIHQDYLFRAVQRGLGQIQSPENASPPSLIPAEQADLTALIGDYEQYASFIANMKNQYWSQTEGFNSSSTTHLTRNPHDFYGGVDITASFGPQSSMRPAGITGVLLRDVHFTSRGQVIRIDEEVIVEAYRFFARDVFSTRNHIKQATVTTVDDEVSVTHIVENY